MATLELLNALKNSVGDIELVLIDGRHVKGLFQLDGMRTHTTADGVFSGELTVKKAEVTYPDSTKQQFESLRVSFDEVENVLTNNFQ